MSGAFYSAHLQNYELTLQMIMIMIYTKMYIHFLRSKVLYVYVKLL